MNGNAFDHDPEEMRRIGHRVVDVLVDLLGGVDSRPVFTPIGPAEMARKIPRGNPRLATDLEELLRVVVDEVVPHSTIWGHPRNFSYVPGSSTWIGSLADLIASALNLEVSVWRESPGPVHLELEVIEWFRGWVGFPEGSSGLLVSGGSAANLTALAAGRQATVGAGHPEAMIYCSSEVHSSVTRAARVLGYGADQIRAVEVDRLGRMSAADLEITVVEDVLAGRVPSMVVASGGTTSTGAVDPLEAIEAIARRHQMWFHVDAAYGGFAVLSERGRHQLGRLDLADSLTLDPHKWLFQPYEVGALLVKDPTVLEAAFRMRPAYLQDTTNRQGEVNMADRGLQQTRAFRALKVWMSVKAYGLEAFRESIDHSLDLAKHVECRIEASGRFELLSPAQLSIVCFRRVAETDEEADRINRRLVEGLLASGEGFLSSTRVNGHHALRMCLVNPGTNVDDVDRVLDWLERH